MFIHFVVYGVVHNLPKSVNPSTSLLGRSLTALRCESAAIRGVGDHCVDVCI